MLTEMLPSQSNFNLWHGYPTSESHTISLSCININAFSHHKNIIKADMYSNAYQVHQKLGMYNNQMISWVYNLANQ